MKRNTLIILLVALVLALTIPAALAQPTFPSNGITGVQAVNLDTSEVTIQATYYAQSGTPYTLVDQTLANQGDSHTYYAEPGGADSDPPNSGNPSSFSGAAILSADKQIAAIANTTFSNGAGGAYGGSNSGSTSVLLPLALVNYYGTTSAIGIQNTDTASAVQAVVTFSPQGGTSFDITYSIEPGASKIIDLGTETNTNFTDGWIGSASIAPADGSTPLVASAMIYSSKYVYAYSGFTSTGDVFYLPLIRSEFAGLSTGVQVVSASTNNSVVTIDYSGAIYDNGYNIIDPDYTCSVAATLPAGSSVTFYNAGSWPLADVIGATDGAITGGKCDTNGDTTFGSAGWFLGSAKITSASGDVAVVVNDANAGGTSSGAYNGFLAVDAAANIISPLARVAFYGITSGTQVQNICDTAVTAASQYSTSSISQNQNVPSIDNVPIPAGGSYTYFIPTGGDYDGWLGSLTVSTVGGESCLVGITNDAPSSGDSSVFNTFAMP